MAEATHPVVVPRETVNDDFVIFLGWLVSDRSFVRAGQPIAEIETSKAAIELMAERDGYLLQSAIVNEQVAVGASLGSIFKERPSDVAQAVPKTQAQAQAPHGGQKLSKKAQELIAQHGLDVALFAGKSLVREQDVRALIETGTAVSPVPPGPNIPARGTRRGLARIATTAPLSPTKRTEIRYLAEANSEALVSAITVIVRTRGLDEQIRVAQTTRRMSYLDFVIAAVARHLPTFRELNAFYSAAGINYYAEVNVGTAFNLGKGLLVPVIRNANQLSPEDISRIGSEYAMKYLRGELTESDLSGGTFTVTDLSSAGAYGVLPLMNRDQAAILAMGHDPDRQTIALTLAFDHRVSDGLQATEFLHQVKGTLEGDIAQQEVVKKLSCGNCFITLDRLAATRVTSFLMQVVNVDGERSYLCQVCLAGWNG